MGSHGTGVFWTSRLLRRFCWPFGIRWVFSHETKASPKIQTWEGKTNRESGATWNSEWYCFVKRCNCHKGGNQFADIWFFTPKIHVSILESSRPVGPFWGTLPAPWKIRKSLFFFFGWRNVRGRGVPQSPSKHIQWPSIQTVLPGCGGFRLHFPGFSGFKSLKGHAGCGRTSLHFDF